MSFPPPTSVSIVWALSDPAVAGEVRAAHDFLQDHAAFTRRGKGGTVQAGTDGYVTAAFTHRTSRALDPQNPHPCAGGQQGASQQRRALASIDGRKLFEIQKAAGLVYKSGLRADLTARQSVAWAEVDRNGGGQIDVVPETLVAGFSKRRDEVLAAGGNSSPRKRRRGAGR
jgi:conjugative relaxase-like TrwC/TraI family protein